MTQAVRSSIENVRAQVVEGFLGSLPTVLYAVLLALLALLVSAAFAWATRKLLISGPVRRLLEKMDTDLWLSRLGAQRTTSEIVPQIVFWMLFLVFVRSAADALELIAISEAIGALIGYIPVLLGAVLILLVGAVLAKVAGSAVRSAADGAGISYGVVLGRIVTVAVLAVIAVMAADQLGVDTAVVQLTLGAVLLALSLSFSLAFGLGARDVTRSILAGHYVRKTLRVGRDIRVGDLEGTLVGMTGTHLLIERNGKTLTVANRVMMESIIEQ